MSLTDDILMHYGNAVYAAISKWQEISASLPHHLVKINSVQASVSS